MTGFFKSSGFHEKMNDCSLKFIRKVVVVGEGRSVGVQAPAGSKYRESVLIVFIIVDA